MDISILKRARELAYTSENIQSAFRATGIHPLNARVVLDKISPSTPPPLSPTHTPLNTPNKPQAVRRMLNELCTHVTGLTSPSTRRSVASKLEKLANAAQQALVEAEILRNRVATLEAALDDKQNRARRGGRRIVSTQRAVTGAELLRRRRELDERGSQSRRGGGTRRGRGRARRSSTTSSMDVDESEQDTLDTSSDGSLSEGSVIFVASRR